MCTYSNFSPKIGCHGNTPLSLVYGSVTDEIPDVTNPTSEPISAWIWCIQLKLWLLMAALYVIGGPVYFCPVVSFYLLLLSSFYVCPVISFYLVSFFIPSLISAAADWMSIPYFHTWCGPSANLECRSEMCCTRLAGYTGRKNDAKNRHLRTIAQLCRAISSQLRHVSSIGKELVKQQYLPHMAL